MKYWAYLMAKFAGVAGMSTGLYFFLHWAIMSRYTVHDLRSQFAWSCGLFGWGLVTAGLIWLAVLDQRYRCRTCLRQLRMPVATGSWDKAILFSRPQLEWICPYGHGTMNVPQVQLIGREDIEWDEHQDMWKELESIGSGRE